MMSYLEILQGILLFQAVAATNDHINKDLTVDNLFDIKIKTMKKKTRKI